MPYKRKILVIEDNQLNREMLKELLSEQYHVFLASNGQEGLRILEENADTISQILLDVMMPVMDGLAAARTIRNSTHPDGQSVPIVAVSANAFDEDIKRSIASGMNAHLSKPIEPKKLRQMVQQFASRIEK